MPDLQSIRTTVIEQTYREVLPGKFASPMATVMLLAIGRHESLFEHRQQIGGPARSFWQFEMAGIGGVLQHKATLRHAMAACAIRGVTATTSAVYTAMRNDDLLGCAFARLLLYTDPKPLPAAGQGGGNVVDVAFGYYVNNWRPGAYWRGSPAQREALRQKWHGHYAAALQAYGA